MRIAIASGKGGTGKTTVATNLAVLAARSGQRVCYLDCDVEEPNGALFLRPAGRETRRVGRPVPIVNMDACTGCGKCGEICQFSAILPMGGQVLTFPALCHGCGGCRRVCPAEAIEEGTQPTGTLEVGDAEGIRFIQGLLDVGQAMSPPVIRAVKAAGAEHPADLWVIDAPPGTSCPVIETIRDADFVVLVTEPTPFGLHDLQLAIETCRLLGLPCGVVVNRADGAAGDERTREVCRDADVNILAAIPDDRRIAEAYSRGRLAIEAVAEVAERFKELLAAVTSPVGVAGLPGPFASGRNSSDVTYDKSCEAGE
jgi:MinD superfamily P-loop ATPase